MDRDKRLRTLDEHIAESLRASEKSGELKTARDYGKPLNLGDGYDDTPPELRMAMKMLKDSGFAPPEVALMHELATLREALATHEPGSDEAARLRQAISDLQVKIAMRLEKIGGTRTL
jgi:hypothetical protein